MAWYSVITAERVWFWCANISIPSLRKTITAWDRLGSVTSNLHALKPSDGYKNDLRTYLGRYNALKQKESRYIRSWVNLYLKMMRTMAKQDCTIDLITLTRMTSLRETYLASV